MVLEAPKTVLTSDFRHRFLKKQSIRASSTDKHIQLSLILLARNMQDNE